MMKNWLIAMVAGAAMAVSGAVAAQGDAAAGKQKAAACAACHGVDGNSANPEWPKIAGLGADYFVKQLMAFQQGQRKNPLMTPVAQGLSEQDMKDLAAYYTTLTMQPGGADKSLVELGQRIYQGGLTSKGVPACAACHGPAGAGNPAAGYPRLGGQQPLYVVNQLKLYKSGERSGAMMNDIAAKLSEEEMRAVASYASGLYRAK